MKGLDTYGQGVIRFTQAQINRKEGSQLMKQTVTKQVKNLDPDIWNHARAAALKAGQNIGVWVTDTIKERLQREATERVLELIPKAKKK